MTDLITLAEYKELAGLQAADTRKDSQISALIPGVSRAVRNFTGRQFEISGGLASSRTFAYDGSGILDIDDCVTVTSLATDAGVPGQTYNLDDNSWVLMPQSDEVSYYVLILGGPFSGSWSGEMGFRNNLDNYEFSGRMPMVTVTATWGWTAIPEDVKLATYWTISDLVSRPSGESLTAEQIAGYSRSWGRGGVSEQGIAIPNRARDVLSSYAKLIV